MAVGPPGVHIEGSCTSPIDLHVADSLSDCNHPLLLMHDEGGDALIAARSLRQGAPSRRSVRCDVHNVSGADQEREWTSTWLKIVQPSLTISLMLCSMEALVLYLVGAFLLYAALTSMRHDAESQSLRKDAMVTRGCPLRTPRAVPTGAPFEVRCNPGQHTASTHRIQRL